MMADSKQLNLIAEAFKNQLIRIPIVKSLAKLKHQTGINQDPDQVDQVYTFYKRAGQQLGSTILELGPGQTWQVADQFCKDGAQSVYLCDIERYFPDSALQDQSIMFLPYQGKEIPLPSGCIDLVCSSNVYEHLRYPDTTIRETWRVLKQGGAVIHSIDLRDHYFDANSTRTFECLRYSQERWNAMTWHRSVYVNRLRASEWIRLHAQAGFQICWTEVVESLTAKQAFAEGGLRYLRTIDGLDRFTHRLDLLARKV